MTTPDSAPTSLPADLVRALERIAAVDTLLVAIDFDGTMAPFSTDPLAVRPLPRSAAAVTALAGLVATPTAILSGRDLATLRQLTGAEPPVRLTGSHGAEPDDGPALELDAQRVALLDRVEASLTELADAHDGAWVENKPASRVLHTRPMTDDAAAAALEATATERMHALDGVSVTAGRRVVEAAVTEVTKGTWLSGARERLGANAAIYIGDDVTDERAFAVLVPGTDVTVKVGTGETTAAHRIADVEDVSDLLELLVDLRRRAVDIDGVHPLH